jgi:hypothetical protein
MPVLKALAGLFGGILFIVGAFTAVGLVGIPLLLAAKPLIEFYQKD